MKQSLRRFTYIWLPSLTRTTRVLIRLRDQLLCFEKHRTSGIYVYLHCSVFKEHHCLALVTQGVDSFYMLSQLIRRVNNFFLAVVPLTVATFIYVNITRLPCKHLFSSIRYCPLQRFEYNLKLVSYISSSALYFIKTQSDNIGINT